jgi:phospholipid:diacylglycerol acyltransferase
MGEGDGTVSLLSSGYMCNRVSPRGGPSTGDHVDILGRSSLNDLILRVAGGKGDLIEETVYSNIREYSDKVKIWNEE